MVAIDRAKLAAVAAAAVRLASLNGTEQNLEKRLDRGWQPSYVLDAAIGSTCRYNGINLDNPFRDLFSNPKDAKEGDPTNACGPLAFNFWQETSPDQDNYGSERVAALAEEGQRQRSAVDCDRGTAGTGPENQVLALGGIGFYGTDGSKSIRILGRAASLDTELNTVHYIKPQETLYELPYPTSRSACSTSDTLFPSPAPTSPSTTIQPPTSGPTPAPSKRVCSAHNLYKSFYKKNGRLDLDASVAYVKKIYAQKAFGKSVRDQMLSVIRSKRSDEVKVKELERLAVQAGDKVYKHEYSFKVCWSVPA